MSPLSIKLFLTGAPGCGKTTVIRRAVDRLRPTVEMSGFLTEEIIEGGRRRGFQGVTLDGSTFLLADRGLDSAFRVGPYGVDLLGLETIGLPTLRPGPGTRLIVLDEVGKMESFSTGFRRSVEELLAGETPLLATVASHGVGFVKQIRHDHRITLLRMSRQTRAGVVNQILRILSPVIGFRN